MNTLWRDFKSKPQLSVGSVSYYTGGNGFHSLQSHYIVHFTNSSSPEGLLGTTWKLYWALSKF